MKLKSLAAAALALLLTLNTAVPAAADTAAEAPAKNIAYYGFFGGTVQEIVTRDDGSGLKMIHVTAGQDQEAHLVLAPDTPVFGTLKEGARVTGYYDNNAPMIMIYPPQYPLLALAVEEGSGFVKVDRFNSDLVSSDNLLKVNLAEGTPVTTLAGKPFTGSLADRDLAVFYKISTKSIPAQTTPERIVVLYSRTTAPVSNMTGPEIEAAVGPVGPAPVMVEGRRISTPAPFVTEEGVIMVPVRAIAEALGHPVGWLQETRSVTVGKHVTFRIGQGTYTNSDALTHWQAAPAVLKNGSTYVPLQFFKALGLANNAYFFEGQFDIDNGEPMN